MFPPDLVHILGRALVASVPRGNVELEARVGVLEVVILGQLVKAPCPYANLLMEGS